MTRALLVIDLQNGVCKSKDKEIYNYEKLISLANERIDDYHELDLPVIFVQHEDEELKRGSKQWQLDPTLNSLPTDIYVGKTHPNSFYKTRLEVVLNDLGVNELEICGAQTEYCIDTTIKMAHGLGYKIMMKHGASSTFDNRYLSAAATIKFFEQIWNERFLEFI